MGSGPVGSCVNRLIVVSVSRTARPGGRPSVPPGGGAGSEALQLLPVKTLQFKMSETKCSMINIL